MVEQVLKILNEKKKNSVKNVKNLIIWNLVTKKKKQKEGKNENFNYEMIKFVKKNKILTTNGRCDGRKINI